MASRSSERCGHPNKTRGRPRTCQRRVAASSWSVHCYQHRGSSPIDIPAARAAASTEWKCERDGRVRAVLGRRLYTDARAAGRTLCDDLAALAAALDRVVADTHDAATAALARGITGSSRSELVALIARHLVDEVSASASDTIATVTRGLRVCGVLLCVLDARRLDRCRCLTALAGSVRDDVVDATVDAGIQHVLEHGLDPFLPATAARR